MKCELKHKGDMGMGHLWFKRVGHLRLNGWDSYDKVSYCFCIGNRLLTRNLLANGVYRIAGNFRWCKFSRKSVQTLQKKFLRFLFSRMRDALATPLPVDGHASYAKRH